VFGRLEGPKRRPRDGRHPTEAERASGAHSSPAGSASTAGSRWASRRGRRYRVRLNNVVAMPAPSPEVLAAQEAMRQQQLEMARYRERVGRHLKKLVEDKACRDTTAQQRTHRDKA
jgi:hypothetical protein